MGSVAGAAHNLSLILEKDQQTNNYEINLSNKISTMLETAKVESFVNDKAELDAKAGPIMSLMANAVVLGNRVLSSNTDSQAKEIANQLRGEAQRGIAAVNNFYRKNGIYVEDLESTLSPHNPPVAAPVTTPAKPQTSVADAAKNLAKALEARVDALTTGPQRAAQLKQIEQGVKALQNYFRHLQKSGGLPGYFARMEIASALQKIYSILEYSDLDIVQSLSAGRGVPETPDSKI